MTTRRAQESTASPSRTRRSARGWVLRFVLWWGGMMIVPAVCPGIDWWARTTTADTMRAILASGGADRPGAADEVSWGGAHLKIEQECTTVECTLVLWAAILATALGWRCKLAGCLAGAGALWGYNLLRIASLAVVLRWRPRLFESVHLFIWQAATLLVVLACYSTWMEMCDTRRRRH